MIWIIVVPGLLGKNICVLNQMVPNTNRVACLQKGAVALHLLILIKIAIFKDC
jgi:hypothetical protein